MTDLYTFLPHVLLYLSRRKVRGISSLCLFSLYKQSTQNIASSTAVDSCLSIQASSLRKLLLGPSPILRHATLLESDPYLIIKSDKRYYIITVTTTTPC